MKRLLHVFSTFDPGGPQVRALDLIAAWPEEEHLILPMDGRAGAASRLPKGIRASVLTAPRGGSGSSTG